MNKLTRGILTFALAFAMLVTTVFAGIGLNAKNVQAATGSCGENLTWRVSGSDLYIEGKGTIMNDYDIDLTSVNNISTAPWYSAYRNSITRVIINAENLTNIGNCAFAQFTKLKTVLVGSYNLWNIGEYAFYNCTSLTTLGKATYTGTTNKTWSLTDSLGNDKIVLNNVVRIYDSAFANCTSLKVVRFDDTLSNIENNAFKSCTNLYLADFVTLSSSGPKLSRIDESVFQYHYAKDMAVIIPERIYVAGDSTLKTYTSISDYQAKHSHEYSASSTDVCIRCGYIRSHVHSLVHHAATQPSCKGNGNYEYWQCSVCGKCFLNKYASDDGSVGVNGCSCTGEGHELACGKITHYTDGRHNTIKKSKSDPTCSAVGIIKDCYYCPDCGLYFDNQYGLDATGKVITKDSYTDYAESQYVTAKVATAHSCEKIAAKAATCGDSGNSEYYKCKYCGKLFSDAAGTKEITLASVTIAKTGKHKLTYVAANDADCTHAGNQAYYKCSVCNHYYTDAAGSNETSLAAVTISRLGHKSVRVTATNGYVYYYCSRPECYKAFSDAAMTKEISWITVMNNGGASSGANVNSSSSTSSVDDYVITQAKEPQYITDITKSSSFKASALKKKSKAFYIGGVAEGTLKYKKLSGSSKITVNGSTGKVTVAKGTKKGTYTLSIRVRAAATDDYYGAVKTIRVTVRVK